MLQQIRVNIASVITATGVACMHPSVVAGAGLQSVKNVQPSITISERVKVFVLTGQSNSLGTSADPAEPDISPGESLMDSKIAFFWRNRSTRSGDGPSVLYGESGGKICGLRAQQGEGANPLFWGPEIGFGRRLAAAGETNVLIIKASRGGGGNSYWLKQGEMYGHVVETVRQALSALPQGVAFDIVALLYIQGESDSVAEAEVSGERLRLLVQNLRKDLPNAEHLKVLIGGIATPGAKQDTVRRQQSELARSDPAFHYIDTLDLSSQTYDGVHFNKSAKLQIGRRMADAWLENNDLLSNGD